MKLLLLAAALLGATAVCAQPAPPSVEVSHDPEGRWLIFFDWGKAEVTQDGAQVLDRLAEELAGDPAKRATLAGHSDRSGPDAANRAMSRRRAEAARAYLLAHGVPAAAASVDPAGAVTPLVPTEAGVREAQNRFVAIRVTP